MTQTRVSMMILSTLFLVGCGTSKEILKVPQYQELLVSHPTETSSPVLRNPTIRVIDLNTVKDELNTSIDKPTLYYCMTLEGIENMMLDDVAKLEYAQSETARANFYKNLIDDSNRRIRELNSKVLNDK